jgi:hypothetical protein
VKGFDGEVSGVAGLNSMNYSARSLKIQGLLRWFVAVSLTRLINPTPAILPSTQLFLPLFFEVAQFMLAYRLEVSIGSTVSPLPFMTCSFILLCFLYVTTHFTSKIPLISITYAILDYV